MTVCQAGSHPRRRFGGIVASMAVAESPPLRSAKSGERSGIGVLVAAILAMGLTGPGQTIGVSVFIDDLVDGLGISRTQVSNAYLVGTLSASLLLPVVGRQIDRFGVKRSQVVIGLIFGLALLNMSLVTGLITLTIGFFGIRLMGQGSLSLVALLSVSLRFDKSRGTALGVYTMAAAGLLALVPIGLSFVISEVGWRSAWRVAAVVVAVVAPALALAALRKMPKGAVAGARYRSDGDLDEQTGVDRNTALGTRGFWIVASVSGSTAMLITGLTFHQIDLLGDVGLSEEAAAAMFLPQVLGSSIVGLLVGASADRIGVRYLPALGGILLTAALLLGSVAAPGALVFVYAVTVGAAGGAVNTMGSTVLPLWFGTKHLGSIKGTMQLINAGASALGPASLALLEAQFGSYPPAILVLASLAVAATLFAFTQPAHIRVGHT